MVLRGSGFVGDGGIETKQTAKGKNILRKDYNDNDGKSDFI